MGSETKSVLSYLAENKIDLERYFSECEQDFKMPNYSEFCRKYLNGETREGVSFNSIAIKRRPLTEYIRKEFGLWKELN